MDKQQLEKKLGKFTGYAAKKGYPIEYMCLERAFSWDPASPYNMKVVVKWLDEEMDKAKALRLLTRFLWDTTDEKTRMDVWALLVYESEEEMQRDRERAEAANAYA